MDEYQNLANAVVLQAVEDYRKAIVKAKHWNDEVEKLENYFASEDFKLYTTLDGPTLAEEIKQEVIDYNYSLSALRRAHAKSEKEEQPE